jgi:IS5 family transposase
MRYRAVDGCRFRSMLRVYCLQQCFDLSDPAAEDMLNDSESMRRFARIELSEDTVPDESTILRFRHLLEQHQLTAQTFDLVRPRWTPKSGHQWTPENRPPQIAN